MKNNKHMEDEVCTIIFHPDVLLTFHRAREPYTCPSSFRALPPEHQAVREQQKHPQDSNNIAHMCIS